MVLGRTVNNPGAIEESLQPCPASDPTEGGGTLTQRPWRYKIPRRDRANKILRNCHA